MTEQNTDGFKLISGRCCDLKEARCDHPPTHLQDLENIVLTALNVAGQPEEEALEQMKIISPMLEEALKSYVLWVIENGKPEVGEYTNNPLYHAETLTNTRFLALTDYETKMKGLIE